ncbi:ABC transporter permease [Acinetobacter sp. B5B]|uniref:methionine ABC transporter permease n=1 Tax=Acinetobacter baretiae TaxID=2605383 RepID=UPI0018C1F2A5|nr:methionine ABC transporter permease [Acinetobacter baretiae]MBF7682704.1 ABC transporter permease [Acinetobacter baretiae]MBF7684938.1 ABC transporter permease [Acinetobacter baretiae]
MKEAFIEWLTQVTQPVWTSLVSVEDFMQALEQTIYMVVVAFFFGAIWGFLQAITLVLTRDKGILPNKAIYQILNPIVNALRSLPFVILMIAMIPITKFITGKTIGTAAAIVPLVVYIGPYMGRLIETSLLEVNEGIIESAQAMGATPLQIIFKFVLPEARSSLILNLTTANISLIGATAMAGVVGGGGIGDLAYAYGYQRFDTFIMILTIIVLLILVQIAQTVGHWLSKLRW